ncbi:MAG TPA: ATP-binding cassette domain-containing protein [Pirellulaceae bacterium]|nr:ATP-binding cassette domain-containing protein [Pirellulaceae bacterium]
MALITLRDLSIGFRGPLLLDSVNCTIEPGQRIGLLGRNGAGKTTLLRMLSGEMEPDHGELLLAPGTKVAFLQQEVPQGLHGTVEDVVRQGLELRASDHEPAWKGQQRLETTLSKMNLPTEALVESLSSGMKRRVLLARALVASPDLLLLDEPTNHLDIESIAWLEETLLRWNTSLMFITHDRMFLRKLATRILEIDRGRLFDWSCDYDTFLKRKEDALSAEEKQNALFDKKLAQEEVWIRQGIKARRTRNEGRVRALESMRQTRQERRAPTEKVQLELQESQRSGALVAHVNEVSFAYDGHDIFRDFSTTIMRGDKIGIMGRNGAGKTTLLRTLLGQLTPQSGTVRLGTSLQIAYFDQLRAQLNENETVQESVGDGHDTVFINGQGRHVLGYLQDFLFSPDRARTLIKFLSGGERNRVLLAKLFAKPANVIVLDEPTNDLDTETLEMLEERLMQFEGTVLLVSHDRAFLNNVVTSTIVFEEQGMKEYVGGYDDWLRQRGGSVTLPPPTSRKMEAEPRLANAATKPKSDERQRRMSYKEKLELQEIPKRIEQIEAAIAEVHELMAKPTFYQQAGGVIANEQSRLKDLEAKLAKTYERWETLEQLGE